MSAFLRFLPSGARAVSPGSRRAIGRALPELADAEVDGIAVGGLMSSRSDWADCGAVGPACTSWRANLNVRGVAPAAREWREGEVSSGCAGPSLWSHTMQARDAEA